MQLESMDYIREARAVGKVTGDNQRERMSSEPRESRSRHCDTIHRRILERQRVSRVPFRQQNGPFHAESCAQSSFGEMLTSELYTIHSQQPLGPEKSFRLGPRKAYRSPD
ncbi:hypothetical protein CRG98_020833 [Punica granatum]|uniref:Uncharacterized protein n=1 Tax=Punica granatum TaxID=22663 RepID=A0A2I0JR63_PUNGR|nr:hypothetical protein CRG98_020833 [Punica granatum]